MRRLKVDVDLDSGYVLIKTTVEDFIQVTTAAALNCRNGLSLNNGRREETERYYRGLLHFVSGIEQLISMKTSPEDYNDPIPLIRHTTKERWRMVEQERFERQLLDRIIDEALAAHRKKEI